MRLRVFAISDETQRIRTCSVFLFFRLLSFPGLPFRMFLVLVRLSPCLSRLGVLMDFCIASPIWIPP